MKQLQNKVTLVSGAHQGIGFAITQRLAAEGAIVYALDIQEGAAYGDNVSFMKGDVAIEADWKNAVQQVLCPHSHYGTTISTVNNLSKRLCLNVLPGNYEDCRTPVRARFSRRVVYICTLQVALKHARAIFLF